ncbi:Ku protein [Streptomyces sp. W007]|nr:Ku protein [Streptomyces sp. W007]
MWSSTHVYDQVISQTEIGNCYELAEDQRAPVTDEDLNAMPLPDGEGVGQRRERRRRQRQSGADRRLLFAH